MAFANARLKGMRLVVLVLLLAPVITYYYYYSNYNEDTLKALLIPTSFYISSLLFYAFSSVMEQFARPLIKSLIITGSLSYGLYIVHWPILTVFNHPYAFSGSPFTFIVRLAGFIAISVLAAFLLKKRFQLWVIRRFF